MIIFHPLSDKSIVVTYLQADTSSGSWSSIFAGDNGMLGDGGGEKYSGGGGLFDGE